MVVSWFLILVALGPISNGPNELLDFAPTDVFWRIEGMPVEENTMLAQLETPDLTTLPGLMKIEVKRKPATKARKGINPFTGQETMFKAKPARNVVKIRPLKKVKDMVA